MSRTIGIDLLRRARLAFAALAVVAMATSVASVRAADEMPNACPVDGCTVKVVGVKKSGDELELTLDANFTPDVSKNHFHFWWGEKYEIQQVSRNAETVHKVTQGKWHLTDNYPVYVTQSEASVGMRDASKSLCATAADRNHNIIDIKAYHCVDVSGNF